MDNMVSTKEATIIRGLGNVYSGLGMLLGTGHLSAATHDHILSLLNEKESPGLKDKDDDGEKPPMGHPPVRKDPPPLLACPKLNLTIARQELPKPGRLLLNESGADSVDSSSSETQGTWHSAIPEMPLSSQDGHAPEPPVSHLVCPWYATPGYHCREQRRGNCAWLHESSPDAVAEPLICSFWAENMCTKTAENCRFAHYWAQHRQIAPTPGARHKRQEHEEKPSWRARMAEKNKQGIINHP